MSRRPPWIYRFVADRSGQSNPLAVVLLLGIVVTGTGVIVTLGSTAIGETRASADVGQAEQAMTQFDSKTSLVAHGASDTQRTRVATSGEGAIGLDENAGRMKVEIVNESDGTVEDVVMDTEMGAVVYERGDTTVAYQGGGVWRGDEGGSVMVSPPEFHYRRGTLTLPLVTVTGQAASGGELVVRQTGPSTGLYPDETATPARTNPLDDGRVNVTVTSEYYEAWGRYFAERTAGNVTYDHPNNRVQIELVVPFDEGFNNVVATTQPGGITVNGADPPPTPYATGVDYPSADARIETKVSNCQSGGCLAWTTTPTGGGTYYRNGDFSGNMNIDTSAGDVELVVNGDVDFSTVTVTGGNNVTVYVREDFDVSAGSVNAAPGTGNPEQFRTVVHSDGDVDNNGNWKYVGLVYAPGSEVDFNGGGAASPNIVGGVVAETIDINGNPNDFMYDEDLDTVGLGLGTDAPTILYLHVSTTEVEVDD